MNKNKVVFLCDIINFILGIMIIIMVIALFFDIEARMIMIPAILCFGGIMNLLTAAKYDAKRKRFITNAFWIVGCALQIGAMISIIKIWRS